MANSGVSNASLTLLTHPTDIAQEGCLTATGGSELQVRDVQSSRTNISRTLPQMLHQYSHGEPPLSIVGHLCDHTRKAETRLISRSVSLKLSRRVRVMTIARPLLAPLLKSLTPVLPVRPNTGQAGLAKVTRHLPHSTFISEAVVINIVD